MIGASPSQLLQFCVKMGAWAVCFIQHCYQCNQFLVSTGPVCWTANHNGHHSCRLTGISVCRGEASGCISQNPLLWECPGEAIHADMLAWEEKTGDQGSPEAATGRRPQIWMMFRTFWVFFYTMLQTEGGSSFESHELFCGEVLSRMLPSPRLTESIMASNTFQLM